MTDTPEQDAEDADRTIAALQKRFAWEHDDHEKTKSELRVLQMASSGTIRLQRVQIAALKQDKASLRRNWAGVEGDHWAYIKTVQEWESRTGLDMNEVLKGKYGEPWGIYGHNSFGGNDD